MPCSTINTTQEKTNENMHKLVFACDYLLSSSDSSDDELQYIYVMQKKKIQRIKHYVTNIVDHYTEEEVKYNNIY